MASERQAAVQEAVKDAMRAKDKERLGVLRLITAEFKRIEVDERIELDDARVLAVLDKMQKQRRDSSTQYRAAGRLDLAEREDYEISVIGEFLPAQLGAAELESLVRERATALGASSVADMGKLMGDLKPRVQGRADMTEVSRLVKVILG